MDCYIGIHGDDFIIFLGVLARGAGKVMTFNTFTPFDQVMLVVAVLSLLGAIWGYFYTHSRKK
jgi:hypothetical protein